VCACACDCMCVCVCVCVFFYKYKYINLGYSDLLFVFLARMRGKNSFGLALNQSVIIVFVAMIVAANARHPFQGEPISPPPRFILFTGAKTDSEYRVSVQAVGK
jgi:hypothetical protein